MSQLLISGATAFGVLIAGTIAAEAFFWIMESLHRVIRRIRNKHAHPAPIIVLELYRPQGAMRDAPELRTERERP